MLFIKQIIDDFRIAPPFRVGCDLKLTLRIIVLSNIIFVRAWGGGGRRGGPCGLPRFRQT